MRKVTKAFLISFILSSSFFFCLPLGTRESWAKGYIQLGKAKLEQRAAYFLCMPGQPTFAQDQTSGIYALSLAPELAESFPSLAFLSVGDDSGQVFAFSLQEGYLQRMTALRLPPWRLDLDLEDITVLAETSELIVSLERGDTSLRILKCEGDNLFLEREIPLELPPGYERYANIGPEGLAYDKDGSYLIISWEGNEFCHPRLRPFLSIYKLFLGEKRITSYKFLRHIELPTSFRSACGLFYLPELRSLLVLDRNADAIYVVPHFSTKRVLSLSNSEYCFRDVLRLPIFELTDPLGREFQFHSLEGLTVDNEGTLFLVTDPWRSADFSTYRPVSAEPDSYYKSFVPQMFEFPGFLQALREHIALDP